MWKMFRKMIKTGIVTEELPFKPAPTRYRGKIEVNAKKCDECAQCAAACPAQAIHMTEGKNDGTRTTKLTIDYTRCVLCGICVEHCPPGALRQTNMSPPATRQQAGLLDTTRLTHPALAGATEEENRL